MSIKSVLVTVGSTLFQSLTDTILSPTILESLYENGVVVLKVQYGRAHLPTFISDIQDDGHGHFDWKALKVELMRYTNDFEGLVRSCDAVISHAGSGSILTVLRTKPPKSLLVIPNTSLMDNHQAQLAEEMERNNYLMTSTVETLKDDLHLFLASKRIQAIKPFPEFDGSRFRSILDEMMGFKEDRL